MIAIESEREFGLSVLQRLDAELKRRGDLFRDAGVQDLAGYRDADGREPLPRILLIIDEFQEFFVEDDKLAQDAALLLDRLVRQGRAFGIHVLLGSQTLGGAYSLARSTIGQMAVRIALQCSEADAHLILSDDNTAARLLSRPGEAIYNDANGLVEGNHPFQVVWLLRRARARSTCEQIRELAQRAHGRPPAADRLRGQRPGRHRQEPRCSPSCWPRRRGRRVAPARRRPGWATRSRSRTRRPPSSAAERQQPADRRPARRGGPGDAGHVAGQPGGPALAGRERPALRAVLRPRRQPGRCRLRRLPGASGPPAAARCAIRHASGNGRAGRRSWPTRSSAASNRPQPGDPPLYLFVYDLRRFRDLRKDDDDFGFSKAAERPSAAKQFATILRDGPALGIHTIVWCDTLTTLHRTLDRQSLREFEMRVLFQMSAADSSNLIDTPAASKLGPHRALFYSEEQDRLEKFRPYGLPSDEWLASVAAQLSGRASTPIPTP